MQLPIIDNGRIDSQHSYLVKLLEVAKIVINRSHTPDEASSIAKALLLYTMEHFCEEELEMSQTKYPDLEEHKSQHAYFARKCETLVRQGSKIESSEVVDALQDWLIKHIGVVDNKYAHWKKERAV